jgi:hypothetical protein
LEGEITDAQQKENNMESLNDILKLQPRNINDVTLEEIKEALSQPYQKPNTDIIYSGIEMAEKLMKIFHQEWNF